MYDVFLNTIGYKKFDCDDEIYIVIKYISLIVKNKWFICDE